MSSKKKKTYIYNKTFIIYYIIQNDTGLQFHNTGYIFDILLITEL